MKNTKNTKNVTKKNKSNRINRLHDSMNDVIHPRYIEIGAHITFNDTEKTKMFRDYTWAISNIAQGKCELFRVSRRNPIYHVGNPVVVMTQRLMRHARLLRCAK
jgi:hypothetical protein